MPLSPRQRLTECPATLFGFPATLTLDLDGEPFDVSDCIQIEGLGRNGRGIFINHEKLIRAIDVEREVRKRISTRPKTSSP